jgi:hypothetical protein
MPTHTREKTGSEQGHDAMEGPGSREMASCVDEMTAATVCLTPAVLRRVSGKRPMRVVLR